MNSEMNDRKKLILVEGGTREAEHQLLRAKAVLQANAGDVDSMKLVMEIHAAEKYDALISSCDDDEYAFAD